MSEGQPAPTDAGSFKTPEVARPENPFNERQMVVVQGLVDGLPEREMAKNLGIRSTTPIENIKKEVSSIMGQEDTRVGLMQVVIEGIKNNWVNTESLDEPLQGELSDMQIEVFSYYPYVITDKEIATRLGVSQKAIEKQNANIRQKLGVKTKYQAVAKMLKRRLENQDMLTERLFRSSAELR